MGYFARLQETGGWAEVATRDCEAVVDPAHIRADRTSESLSVDFEASKWSIAEPSNQRFVCWILGRVVPTLGHCSLGSLQHEVNKGWYGLRLFVC